MGLVKAYIIFIWKWWRVLLSLAAVLVTLKKSVKRMPTTDCYHIFWTQIISISLWPFSYLLLIPKWSPIPAKILVIIELYPQRQYFKEDQISVEIVAALVLTVRKTWAWTISLELHIWPFKNYASFHTFKVVNCHYELTINRFVSFIPSNKTIINRLAKNLS